LVNASIADWSAGEGAAAGSVALKAVPNNIEPAIARRNEAQRDNARARMSTLLAARRMPHDKNAPESAAIQGCGTLISSRRIRLLCRRVGCSSIVAQLGYFKIRVLDLTEGMGVLFLRRQLDYRLSIYVLQCPGANSVVQL
jgi:hypothetical protein